VCFIKKFEAASFVLWWTWRYGGAPFDPTKWYVAERIARMNAGTAGVMLVL